MTTASAPERRPRLAGPVRSAGLILLMTCAAACEGPEASIAAPGQDVTAAHAPVTPTASQVTDLSGAWRVAGIDGEALDQPVGLALTGDARQLWWEPRCAGIARTYRIDNGRIAFGPTEPPRPAGEPTAPVCSIGLPPRLDAVVRALDDAESASRTPENGVLISGPAHSLLLFSQ